MTPAEEKVVRQRFSALQLADAFGNLSEACRRRGIARSQFTSTSGASRPTGWKG